MKFPMRNMKMDPDAVGFSGVVEIDVDIQKPTDKIWLHGKTMTVSSATAMIGGEEIPLVLPAGKATLKMVKPH